MKTIVIGFDGSSCSQNVLGELPRLGLPRDLAVNVVHVADVWFAPDGDPTSVPNEGEEWPDNIRKARVEAFEAIKAGRKLAQHAASQARSYYPDWDTKAISTAGPPGRILIHSAETCGADLLIVGSHGRGALTRFFMGSVAQEVARDAPCSVHVSRPRPGRGEDPLRIMVALDGSQSADAALEMLRHRVWPSGAVFQAVGVIDPKVDLNKCLPTFHADQWIRQHDANAGEALRRYLEHALKHLSVHGIEAEKHVLEGDPVSLLLKQADDWRADCVILGAQGLQHGKTRPLGTLAEAMVNGAHCSVEIVRRFQGI